jgi:mannose-6-phosphate isomerase-like protein (cupin superfamily)
MLITAHDAPTFEQHGVTAVGYASPSRGAGEISLWRLAIAAGEVSPPHTLSNEEVFLALGGSAVAVIGGQEHAFAAGDCLVVPTATPFTLTAGEHGFEAVCAMAAGGRATILPDGPTIAPPWAE